MNTYQIDSAHSTAGFNVKHMMIAKVHGAFDKMTGQFLYDPSNVSNSSLEATIDATSINTREGQRDAHLKSADFFDVANFPSITFKSSKVDISEEGLRVVGDLTIRGNTHSVVLHLEQPSPEMKDPWGNIKIGLSGTAKIKRKDFGLTWNAALEAGGVLVGDDVNIQLDVQFAKQA